MSFISSKFKSNKFYRLFILIKNRLSYKFDSLSNFVGFFSILIGLFNYPLYLYLKKILKTNNIKRLNMICSILKSGIGWGVLRYSTPEVREKFSHIYNQHDASNFEIKHTKKLKNPKNLYAEEIRKKGYTHLNIQFNEKDIQYVHKYFKNKPFYSNQVPTQGKFFKDGFLLDKESNKPTIRCVDPNISLECPPIKKFCNSSLIKEIINSYFNYTPPIHSLITFASFKNKYAKHHTQMPHRDYDHFIGLTIFIYWTDVDSNNGATIITPYSNKKSYVKEEISLDTKAGGVYIADTFALHYGKPVSKDYRLATWIRVGSIPNYSYLINDPFSYSINNSNE